MTKLKLVLTLLLLSVFSKSFAQPGGLDASFAGKGLQTYSFKSNSSLDEVYASAADAAGNLYVTGSSTTNITQSYIAKLLPNGKPDLSFGVGGKKILSDVSTEYTFMPRAIALYKDGSGSIVLAGWITEGSGSTPCIVKLNATGAVQGLGSKGNANYVSYLGIVTGDNAMFTGVHILSNGDIIATGDTGDNGDISICRLTSDGLPTGYGATPNDQLSIGLPDPYFAKVTCSAIKDNILYVAGNTGNNIAIVALDYTTGDVLSDFEGGGIDILAVSGDGSPSANYCYAMAIASNGDINLGGYTQDPFFGNRLMNYQIDNLGGFKFCKLYAAGSAPLEVHSMVIDANNKIIMGGFTTASDDNKNWTIIRTKSDGTMDDSDNSFGKTYTLSSSYGINSINRLSDGSLLLAGIDKNDVLIKKITATGAPFPNYGTNSEYRFWLADAESYITDMVVRKDGQLLVSGSYYDPNTSSLVPVIALFTKDGILNTTFGGTMGAAPGVVNIASIAPVNILSQLELTAIQVQDKDNKILVAGTYLVSGEYTDAFLIRLSATGALETSFNSDAGYTSFNTSDSYIHDIAVQKDSKILAYGFMNRSLTLVRYLENGNLDAGGFATNGIYTHPQTQYEGGVTVTFGDEKVELRIQPDDQKIVCAGTSFALGADFLVFRLTPAGTLDPDFGKAHDGIATADFGDSEDYATSICLKPNGTIVVGGYTNNKYGVMQLTSSGVLDTDFGTLHTGVQSLGKNYNQKILHLEAENNNAILASGYMETTDDGKKYITVLRITAAGIFDNTFSGKGEAVFGKGYSKNGAIVGSSYYVAGANDYFGSAQQNSSFFGKAEIIKLKLGTGPVIKTTTLQLSDLQKTFDDAPFQLTPISNSTAPVQYSITHGNCATVNATTGIVTIKCVPSSPDQYIAITAYQPAIAGFSEDDVVINLTVAKAIPKIIFGTQGGIVDNNILLKVSSNSTGDVSYDLLSNPDNALQFVGSGEVYIGGVGCGEVMVTVQPTQNYLQGTATNTVCGYENPVKPVAFNDQITLTYQTDAKATINVLANDEAYSGTIVPSQVDLDPSTPYIQNVYVSPSLGRFSVDDQGNMTYVPFEGFIGSGFISYTIFDSQGSESLPANIYVTQSAPQNTPQLKATELFTPNKDGLNDAFVIGFVDLQKQNQLKVFDRNGGEVYSVNNYRNDWTGDLPNGKQVEDGIYYYIFQEGNNGNERELKGSVELKR